MTRIRVLLRAIKLLEAGWLPYDKLGQARDKDHNLVSYMHPAAVKFTATGAVVRAIYELTGDPADQRDKLWTDTMISFKEEFNNSWTAMYDFFEKLENKEQVIAVFKAKLEEWNR